MLTFKEALCLLAIVVAYGITGRMDYEDALLMEQVRLQVGADCIHALEGDDTLPEVGPTWHPPVTLLTLSTLFFTYENSWRYLPVFKYHIFESDKALEIFVHSYLFNVNLGFYLQLFVLIFSWMIFLSNKRPIAFHLMYAIVILRSLLIVVQDRTLPHPYVTKNGHEHVLEIQLFYLFLFLILFGINQFSDLKKRPRIPEPSEIIKD